MNKIIALLTISILISVDIDIPRYSKSQETKDFKAYGTIEFGDSKEFILTKLKDNDIYRSNDNGAYIITLFDIPFEIEFVYGTNDRKPSFLRAIRLKLSSIVDSYIISKVTKTFDREYGSSEKYYINIHGDPKEYFKWEKDDREIHLDFDGTNINITINSKHFNKLSQVSIDKNNQEDLKKKEDRHKNQLEKLF